MVSIFRSVSFFENVIFSVTGWIVSSDSGGKSRVRYFPEEASIWHTPGCSTPPKSKEIQKNSPPGKNLPGEYLVSIFRLVPG